MGEASGGSFDTVSDFVSTAKGVVATGKNLDESNTKAKIITPLIRTLGWPVYDNSSVLLEYDGGEDFNDRVDYALFGPEGPHDDVYAVVEAKQIGRSLAGDDSQIRRYMRLFGADWGLLTNGKRYRIYQADNERDSDEALVESVDVEELPASTYLPSLSWRSAYATSAAPVADDDRAQIPQDVEQNIREFVGSANTNDLPANDGEFGPLYETLIDLIAPSIEGRRAAKLGLLFALTGGVRKPVHSGRPARGAIHVLFMHDPGTFSTDLAETAAHLAPKPVYLSAADSSEQLLAAQRGSGPSSLDEVSRSPGTMADASHAVLTGFDEIDEDEFGQIQAALESEPPGNGESPAAASHETAGVIATAHFKYGRLDQYEPIGEQLNIDPAVISEFDLIFTLTDVPSESDDAEAERRIKVTEATKANGLPSDSESADYSETGADEIPLSQLQAHLLHAQNNYDPSLEPSAREHIKKFYANVREQDGSESPWIPMHLDRVDTAVRLAEASARLRLSETATIADAERATIVIRSCLENHGLEPESEEEEFDADLSEEQRERVRNILSLVEEIEKEYAEGAPVDVVVECAEEQGMEASKAEHEVEQLKQKGEVYTPTKGHLRTT